MPGRSYNSADYRYGFNAQEKTNEIAGVGNHNTAMFWEYDTRLGRRWNVDPKPQINISDYAVNGNNPIENTDVLGDKFRNWDISSNTQYFRWNGYLSNAKYFADKTNLTQFNSTVLSLAKSNQIYGKVYLQLYRSNTIYNVEQQYTSVPNYSRETKTIGINYQGVGNKAEISESAVFEEFFHAGQDDYYSQKGISRSYISDEVEAKVADLLSGFQDVAISDPSKYSEIKSYFETGKKGEKFDKQVDALIDEVYKSYSAGDDEWAKTNDKNTVDKKTLFSYLERLTINSKEEQKKK